MRLETVHDIKRNLRIKRIKARNFKNFKEIDVTLNDFNVVIGANSSGKSNFIQIFNFLKHIVRYSLDDAISMQGSAEYLVNFGQPDKSIWVEVTFQVVEKPLIVRIPEFNIGYNKCTYAFEIRLDEQSRSEIISDKLCFDLVLLDNPKTKDTDGNIIIEKCKNGKRRIDIKINGKKHDLEPAIAHDVCERGNSLILEDFAARYFTIDLRYFFYRSNVYDFDLKAAKSASTIKGMAGLENNGSNLAVVLKNTLQIAEDQELFLDLLTDFFPFVKSIGIQRSLGSSFVFTVEERHFKHASLPANLISDGTASITAIILALYFEGNELCVFEEPERSIHPGMILKLVETFKDVSEMSQIIVTTHNPELLRHIEIENIFTVTRNNKGESKIIKPEELEDVKQFLDRDMGVEDLFVQKLLGD